MRTFRPAFAVILALTAALAAAWIVFGRLRGAVRAAADPARTEEGRTRPLAFAPPGRQPGIALDLLADPAVLSAAAVRGALWTGGGGGLTDGTRRFDPAAGLPSLRISAVAAWRNDLVFALEGGGWGRITESGLDLASTGWGRLEVRALAESEAGELLVGARQGLFLAPYASGTLLKLSDDPVRALALLPGGFAAAGGEKGLKVVAFSGSISRPVATPDAWIDSLGWDGRRLWASTPLGTCLGELGDPFRLDPHPRGEDVRKGVHSGGAWWGLGDGGRLVLLRSDGTRSEEPNPEGIRFLLASGGLLLGDAPAGLYRKEPAGWALLRKAPRGALPLPHVNALAVSGARILLGFFDGGVAEGVPGAPGAPFDVRPLSGREAWGVNALWPAGETIWAATLRGVFKLRGGRVEAVEGPGGAYSLTQTASGMALGYGQGVALPGRRLLSAFHGLPGNQAYALAPAQRGDALWVGTPTGLGRIENARVTGRALPGEGKLPHPWVTALLDTAPGLVVATWGGGVAVRSGEGAAERWTPFPETEKLRVNAGAIAAGPDGRVWIGTQGEGLWRSDPSLSRFERLDLPLPSRNVYSLSFFPADRPDSLFAGTDEGLVRIPLALDPSRPTEAR